ncbi:MAG: hypothetical protein HC941_32600, partial [Microcoleus sp. SU_5_3]|nr:hypothetical protein [Microcoleus sp. SU_5_3]
MMGEMPFSHFSIKERSHFSQYLNESAIALFYIIYRPNPHQQISLLPEFTDTINPRSPKQVLAALQEQGIPVTSTNS